MPRFADILFQGAHHHAWTGAGRLTGALPASVPLLNDTIDGGNGRDLIFGNNGDDTLKGGGGTDTCDAGGQAGYTTTACEL